MKTTHELFWIVWSKHVNGLPCRKYWTIKIFDLSLQYNTPRDNRNSPFSQNCIVRKHQSNYSDAIIMAFETAIVQPIPIGQFKMVTDHFHRNL